MNLSDKRWLCRLAWMVANLIVHALGSAQQIQSWRDSYAERKADFEALAMRDA